MSDASAYLIRFDEAQRAEFLKEVRDLEAGFSDALSAADWPMKRWEVVGLMFGTAEVTHWALARRTNRVATGKVRVEFGNVSAGVLSIAKVEQRVSAGLKRYVGSARTGIGGKLPPETWSQAKEVISNVEPEVYATIARLERLRDMSEIPITRPGADVVVQQRDAVGIALDIFDSSGESRKEVLSAWAPDEGPADEPLSSFLDGIPEMRLVEGQVIANDASVLDGANRVTQTILGAVFSIGGRKLEVFNVDRTSVEKALGVDLLYFSQEFDSWTLVQYKLLEPRDRGKRVCRLDEQFAKELARMQKFRRSVPDQWPEPRSSSSYRLCADGFLFKFCDRKQLEVLSESLVPGMYVPRIQLETLQASGALRGDGQREKITDQNVGRYLTNTTFAPLVREGWIGTRGISSEQIATLFRATLAGERSLVIAKAGGPGEQVDLNATLRSMRLSGAES